MKARPILFSGPMVRALLDGRKSQTRRVIKPQPTVDQGWEEAPGWALDWKDFEDGFTPAELTRHCPYGQPGDLLWVRETWADDDDGVVFWYKAGVPVYAVGSQRKPGEWDAHDRLMGVPVPPDMRWKPSIHMPRWASRLTLEITGVRVERLQEITEADAIAEGCYLEESEITANDALTRRELLPHIKAISDKKYPLTVKTKFARLWSTIHGTDAFLQGPDSWEANPWVWVLEFRVHQQNVDEFLRRVA